MPVICADCQTENRDAAKFCHGCARKLPGFAATGPSLLEAARSQRSGGHPGIDDEPPGLVEGQNASRGFWIGFAGLMLALSLGFGAWYGYVTREVPLRPPHAGVPAAPPAAAAPRPEPIPLGSSLAAGESAVAPEPRAAARPLPIAPSQPPRQLPTQPETAAAPPAAATPAAPAAPPTGMRRESPAAAPPRPVALDPRQGCRHLNFFAAARCEAAHCDQPAYSRHPRCDAVREDRRRDEARRNPTLGT